MTYTPPQLQQGDNREDVALPALDEGNVNRPVAVAQGAGIEAEAEASPPQESVHEGQEGQPDPSRSTSLTVETYPELESVAHDKTMESFMAVATITAPPSLQDAERVGMDVVAVLDRS